MRVDELVRTGVITVPPGEPLVGCARRMLDHEIRHLPVWGPEGTLLGVVTDDGVFAHGAMLDESRGWMWFDGADTSLTARDVAIPADVAVSPGADLGATLRHLARSTRDFVVLKEGEALVGILTEHDLLRAALALVAPDAPLPMSRPVAVVTHGTTADAALRLQVKLGFRHLVVVDGEGRANGVVSRRDLRMAWPHDQHVGDLLGAGPLVTVSEGWATGAVIAAMRDLHIGCVPVLDADQKPVGIVTRRDVLQLVVAGLEDEALFPSS
jgi:CBS domain-containing protein